MRLAGHCQVCRQGNVQVMFCNKLLLCNAGIITPEQHFRRRVALTGLCPSEHRPCPLDVVLVDGTDHLALSGLHGLSSHADLFEALQRHMGQRSFSSVDWSTYFSGQAVTVGSRAVNMSRADDARFAFTDAEVLEGSRGVLRITTTPLSSDQCPTRSTTNDPTLRPGFLWGCRNCLGVLWRSPHMQD